MVLPLQVYANWTEGTKAPFHVRFSGDGPHFEHGPVDAKGRLMLLEWARLSAENRVRVPLALAAVFAYSSSDDVPLEPRARPLRPGDRVRVGEGSGIDSRRAGIILDPGSQEARRFVGRDVRGEYVEPGRYRPFDRSSEFVIRGDDGQLFTMFKSMVTRIDPSP